MTYAMCLLAQHLFYSLTIQVVFIEGTDLADMCVQL